jgi:hypothetical protein
MNKIFETIGKMSRRGDVMKISVYNTDYFELIQNSEARFFMKIIHDSNALSVGHYATLFGISIYIDAPVNKLKVMFDGGVNWTPPIQYDELDKLDSLKKLQYFF